MRIIVLWAIIPGYLSAFSKTVQIGHLTGTTYSFYHIRTEKNIGNIA